MMTGLTSEQNHRFIDKIVELRQQLNALKPTNALQLLEQFENQQTLNEMEVCFINSEPQQLQTNLVHLLSARWERIRGSNLCYTRQPSNLINQLCLEMAKKIAPPATTAAEIEKLKLNQGPYCLLMPSLESSEDIYGENIHSLSLYEFVLSDKERVFIPIAPCLHHASVSEEGQLRHVVAIKEEYPELTASEVERVSHHSKQAEGFYQAVLTLNKRRLLTNDLGAQLSQLAMTLRKGGSRGSGSELNAGTEANLGIVAFGEYWETLSARQKSAIFTAEPKLKLILGRLFRPNDVNYKETRFCIELLANDLDPIIQRYNKNPAIQLLYRLVLEHEHSFITMAKSCHGLAITQNEIPPRKILHHIFKLSTDEQRLRFKQLGFENALLYALANDPEALSEFELDEASKQEAITAQVVTWYGNTSALIIAAQKGKVDAVRLLLSWGACIESHEASRNNALHWAAYNGHTDTVRFLIDKGALLEAKGYNNNTALILAVRQGKGAVVDLLLKNHAHVNARNGNGKNALDVAIEAHPELIEAILMQMAILPLEQQAEALLNVPNGKYTNVISYVYHEKTALFEAIIDNVLQQTSQALAYSICNAKNKRGTNSLIMAAQLDAYKSIPKLLAIGLDIRSPATGKDNALHCAAYKGHVNTVRCLLDNGGLLEAQGENNDTALIIAIERGNSAVVDLLLKNHAHVNARNSSGKNALDVAIETHPELIGDILMQMAILPEEQQAEALLNVPNGPYESVYTYAGIENPKLLNKLIFHPAKKTNSDADALTAALNKMDFDVHFKEMRLHYQQMKEKSRKNSKYIAATSAAKTLLIECVSAKVMLFQNDADTDTKLLIFKKNCQSAIDTAQPVLKKHREWPRMLFGFFLAFVTFPVSLPLYALGLFSVKTKSRELLDEFEAHVKHIKPTNRSNH